LRAHDAVPIASPYLGVRLRMGGGGGGGGGLPGRSPGAMKRRRPAYLFLGVPCIDLRAVARAIAPLRRSVVPRRVLRFRRWRHRFTSCAELSRYSAASMHSGIGAATSPPRRSSRRRDQRVAHPWCDLRSAPQLHHSFIYARSASLAATGCRGAGEVSLPCPPDPFSRRLFTSRAPSHQPR